MNTTIHKFSSVLKQELFDHSAQSYPVQKCRKIDKRDISPELGDRENGIPKFKNYRALCSWWPLVPDKRRLDHTNIMQVDRKGHCLVSFYLDLQKWLRATTSNAPRLTEQLAPKPAIGSNRGSLTVYTYIYIPPRGGCAPNTRITNQRPIRCHSFA